MSYKALYRTYRPQTFEEMAGQKHILKTLQNAIKENKIAHAYLFTGPRGTGKTSMAKLLAKALNCECGEGVCNKCENCREIINGNHPDVVEIDAASNNGVDEVRNLIDKVKYSPILGKYKVYIIDEVHMMSTGAFNALLKTLEEPPAHVIFILATTEPHKVLPTIISRCQRFDFGRISVNDIKGRIETVLNKEKISYEKDVVDLVCELCEGGMRDALSILDQAVAYAGANLKSEHIREIYGVTSLSEKIKLLNYISDAQEEAVVKIIDEYDDKGVDLTRLTLGLIDLIKEIIIYKNSNNLKILKIIDAKALGEIKEQNINRLFEWVDILVDALSNYKKVNAPKSFFELACLKMAASDGSPKFAKQYIKMSQTSVQESKQQNESTVSLKPISVSTKRSETESTVTTNSKNEESEVSCETKEIYGDEKFVPTEEELLNVLVQATKDDLVQAKQKWVVLTKYLNSSSTARAAILLLDGLPVAAAKNMIVLAYDNETYLNQVNTTANHELMNNFLKALYNDNMMSYCVTKEDFMRLKDTYVKLKKNGELPIPKKLTFGENNQLEDKGLEFGKKIFGDFLKIKEE